MSKKYIVKLNKQYIKDLKKIPKKDQEHIKNKILELEDNPRPEGSKKLQGPSHPPLYRIRIGDYRVVYAIQDNILLIVIITLGHRKDIYQKIDPNN